jgi:hydrogenase maturation protease
MSETLVIGYGNTLRSDDGAGIHAAELIAARFHGIDCISVQELGPDLAESIAKYQQVIFIDAGIGSSGITTTMVEALVETSHPLTHTHAPDALLGLCWQVYGTLPASAYLIELPAFNFAFGENLSLQTADAVEECTTIVATLLGQNDGLLDTQNRCRFN